MTGGEMKQVVERMADEVWKGGGAGGGEVVRYGLRGHLSSWGAVIWSGSPIVGARLAGTLSEPARARHWVRLTGSRLLRPKSRMALVAGGWVGGLCR
jgi:hypothetical protein